MRFPQELPLKGFPELKRRHMLKLGRKCLSRQKGILGNTQTDQNGARDGEEPARKKLCGEVTKAPSLEPDLSSNPSPGAM